MLLDKLRYDLFQNFVGEAEILKFYHVNSGEEVFFCEFRVRQVIDNVKHKIKDHKVALEG